MLIRSLISAAALFAAMALSNAAEPPSVKEGFWSVHSESADNSGTKKTVVDYKLCRNHAYDQYARAASINMKGCALVGETSSKRKYSRQMRCMVGTTVVESQESATFHRATAFHWETHTTYSPAMSGISETTLILNEKYIGACPAPVQPGDRMSEAGEVVHLWKP
jgi:hypothetical protein